MFVLIEISPLLPDGTRPTLRACQTQDRRLTGAADQIWIPAVTKAPALTLKLFDGDFTTPIDPGSAAFSVNLMALGLGGVAMGWCRWAGAPVSIYAVSDADDLTLEPVFVGRIDSYTVEGQTFSPTAKVDTSPFDVDVLEAYAGTGGIEGEDGLKGKFKPWVFGRALNVEPIQIDTINNVLQFSAYGPIKAVNALFERGADLGAPLGNAATLEALLAADIPEGKWATCLALGLVRLGAPPYGVITGDVDGDSPAGGQWIRRTGAIIRRVALKAGIDAAKLALSIASLDLYVNRPVNVVLTEQETVLALAARLALPCNAQAGVSWLGQLFVTRIQMGAPSVMLDAQGRQLPPVLKSTENEVSPPYKRIQMGGARNWRVQTFDEIAFEAPLVDRGDYSAATTYREGNIVSLPDGSRWLYVSLTPAAGHQPADNSEYWASLSGRTRATYDDGTPIEDLKPATPGATAGAPDGTTVGGTVNPDGSTSGGLPAKVAINALAELTGTPDAETIIDRAKASVARAKSTIASQLAAQLLGEDRKTRYERLMHLDGVELSTRVVQEITQRVEGQTAIVERVDMIEATAADGIAAADAAIRDEASVRASADQAETARREEAVSTVLASVDGERVLREAEIVRVETTSASNLDAATDQLEIAISTVEVAVNDERLARQAAITDERSTSADALSAATSQLQSAISSVEILLDGERLAREAAITDERSTSADALSAATSQLQSAISSVELLVNGERQDRQAAITEERNTSAGEAGAIASQVLDLGTQVGQNQASIMFLLETTNGEHAVAQLSLNVNGQISGFKINGEDRLFVVAADRFVVGDSNLFEIDTVTKEITLGGTVGVTKIKPGTPYSIDRPLSKSASNPISGLGVGNWQTVLSLDVPMEAAGIIEIQALLRQGFPNGDRTWEARLRVNGEVRDADGGDKTQNATPFLASYQAGGPGTYTVLIESATYGSVTAGNRIINVSRSYATVDNSAA